MASAIEKVIEIAANNLFDNASVQSCLTAVTDLSNNLDARVNAGVSSVIDSAPGALDTLNELAAALGDDANYAATTAATIAANTSAIATKYQAGNDVSFNDLSANDISGVNFFTTGGSFIGDLSGNVTAHTVTAQNYAVGSTNFISATRQGNFRDLEVKDTNNTATILLTGDGGDMSLEGTLTVDTINEKTDTSGVTIEQVLLKDNIVTAHTVNATNYAVGSTNFISASRQGNFRDLEVKDTSNNATILLTGDGGDMSLEGTLTVDTINEKTSISGVTIDGVLLKDGGATLTGDLSGNDASFNVVDIHTLNLTTSLTKSDVGLGNVDNTTDAGKPVSTAQQTALDLKANLAGPTFTGKVTMGDLSGNDASFNVVDIHTLNLTTSLTKSDVGLGNVDNTTDAGKPVSTVQQTALDLKANVAGPTFTGNVTMSDLSGNDASFNVVDITALQVGGVTIDTNGSAQLDLSIKEVKDLSDVSYNTVTSGQVLSWNTDGFFEPVTQTAGGLNSNSDISINAIDAVDASFNVLRTSGTMSMGGHILPTTNAQYDLGSAEYKIRHLFLSDNSLWIGDDHKIDISGGKMKFKKRKSNTVPQEILDASGGSTEQNHIDSVIAKFGDVTVIGDVKLHHWHEYVADTIVSGVTNLLPHQLFQKDSNFETNLDLLNTVQLPVKTDAGAPLTTPVVGTMTFNSNDNKLYIYNGSAWKSYSADA